MLDMAITENGRADLFARGESNVQKILIATHQNNLSHKNQQF